MMISNPTDFIRDIIEDDLRTGKHEGRVATRFPPEPNGYIHIGHAKSVCLNFGIAAQYQGTCNLRLDDTDPLGESMEYVESIIRDRVDRPRCHGDPRCAGGARGAECDAQAEEPGAPGLRVRRVA